MPMARGPASDALIQLVPSGLGRLSRRHLHGVLIGLGGVIWPCWRRAHDVTHSCPRKRPGWWRSSVTEDNETHRGPAGLGKGGGCWPEAEERHGEADGQDTVWREPCEPLFGRCCRLK